MWPVIYSEELQEWLAAQTIPVQDKIDASLLLLARFGPQLGRPRVDTL